MALKADKSNPLVEQVYELAPLLNGSLGKTVTKVHRYMVTLYAATQVPAFFADGKEIGNSLCFTVYGLGKVAKLLNDTKYERSRVAIKVFKKAEEKGLVELKKDGGETYISLTAKGNKLYSQILIDLITLKRLISIIPDRVSNSIYEKQLDKQFISKGGNKPKPEFEQLIDNLLFKMESVNKIFGDEIILLREDDN